MAQVAWTDNSKRNLKAIHNYIASDSVIYADRFIKSIVRATRKLETFPNCGKRIPQLDHLNVDLREVIYKNYRIIYRTKDNSNIVEILAVVHNRRDLVNLPKQDWEL